MTSVELIRLIDESVVYLSLKQRFFIVWSRHSLVLFDLESSQVIVEPRIICSNAFVFTKEWQVSGRLMQLWLFDAWSSNILNILYNDCVLCYFYYTSLSENARFCIDFSFCRCTHTFVASNKTVSRSFVDLYSLCQTLCRLEPASSSDVDLTRSWVKNSCELQLTFCE